MQFVLFMLFVQFALILDDIHVLDLQVDVYVVTVLPILLALLARAFGLLRVGSEALVVREVVRATS